MGVNNYVKLDAGFYFNPKTDALNAVTRDAYFCSLCCAKLANQDGAFKIAQIQVLTDAQETDFETLFEAGFWERTNSPNIAFVHDYLDWNLSRDEEMRRAVISRNNGAKGGRPKEPKPETQGVNPGGKPSQVTEVGNPDPKPRAKPVKEGRKEGKKELIRMIGKQIIIIIYYARAGEKPKPRRRLRYLPIGDLPKATSRNAFS